MERRFADVVVSLERGDLTKRAADAIVNAANGALLPGGGVCGAIHRAGGPSIAQECAAIRSARGDLEPGEAAATAAGALPARFVFHAVGPVWQGGGAGEPEVLARAYRSCLRLGEEKDIASIAFPSISTGIFGYPVELAAKTAIDVARTEAPALQSIRSLVWVLFDEATFDAYVRALVS